MSPSLAIYAPNGCYKIAHSRHGQQQNQAIFTAATEYFPLPCARITFFVHRPSRALGFLIEAKRGECMNRVGRWMGRFFSWKICVGSTWHFTEKPCSLDNLLCTFYREMCLSYCILRRQYGHAPEWNTNSNRFSRSVQAVLESLSALLFILFTVEAHFLGHKCLSFARNHSLNQFTSIGPKPTSQMETQWNETIAVPIWTLLDGQQIVSGLDFNLPKKLSSKFPSIWMQTQQQLWMVLVSLFRRIFSFTFNSNYRFVAVRSESACAPNRMSNTILKCLPVSGCASVTRRVFFYSFFLVAIFHEYSIVCSFALSVHNAIGNKIVFPSVLKHTQEWKTKRAPESMNCGRWKYNVENNSLGWGWKKYIVRSCVAYARTTMLNAVRPTSAIFFFGWVE